MRVAYADPPYVGYAHYYLERDEVDHGALIRQLCDDFPDGWALSCHSPSLRALLPLCPPDIRVMAWVKPFAVFKPGVNPAYAWEPVLVRGGRRRGRDALTVADFLSARITFRRGLVGVKPPVFWSWLFAVLGLEPDDTFVDLFPGSGGGSAAWAEYCAQQRLPFLARTAVDDPGGRRVHGPPRG